MGGGDAGGKQDSGTSSHEGQIQGGKGAVLLTAAGKSSGDCKGSSEPVLADIPDVGRDGGVSPEKRGYPFGAGADLCGAGML